MDVIHSALPSQCKLYLLRADTHRDPADRSLHLRISLGGESTLIPLTDEQAAQVRKFVFGSENE